jgi:hypothetical protein
MTQDLKHCVIQIRDSKGIVHGTGFVVDANTAVTCAHVVEAAGAGLGGSVTIVFAPIGDTSPAEVLPDVWRLSDAEDIAILRLQDELPSGLIPVILGPGEGAVDHSFRAFGYPLVGDMQGVWARGEILGTITDSQGRRMLQLRAQEIAPGMSGAPVLDIHDDRVVGMVTATYTPDATLKFRDAAFAVPAETLHDLCPEKIALQAPSPPELFASPGSAPPLPALIIGREDALHDLKTRLGIAAAGQVTSPVQVLTAIRGWPGVGKTTIAAALAHEPDIAAAFPDGVLWISLGPTPNLLSDLATWGRALGSEELLRARTLEEASAQLAALLRNKRMLLIVDDVWETEHAMPFKVGGRGCATLITTRLSSVAQALAPTANDIYSLPVLTDDKALALLQALAPTVVAQYPDPCLELVRDLEGLPLALQVAGHLLNVEASYGFEVTDLLAQLREGARLLEAQAPADRVDLAQETTPTVAVLLQKSTERLDELTRDCFAYLGAFAPKPATFDLAAMKAVWQIDDPKPIARTLVDRGLLEYVTEMGRYQMHALLVMHAKSLLTED